MTKVKLNKNGMGWGGEDELMGSGGKGDLPKFPCRDRYQSQTVLSSPGFHSSVAGKRETLGRGGPDGDVGANAER